MSDAATTMPTVLLADDHPPTRAAVRASLERDGFVVCGEAGSAERAVELAEEQRPDICLLDIKMPGGGIRAAARITVRVPEAAVVMLTVSRDDDDLFDALRAGATGYLLKDTDPVRLPAALRGVLAGEAALPRALVAKVMDEFRQRGGATVRRFPQLGKRAELLTEKEWEVLEGLHDGLSTQEIAGRMFVAPVTVRTHVAAILKKLRLPDREAVLRLLEER